MAEELKAGCARPTGGPVGETAPEKTPESDTSAFDLEHLKSKKCLISLRNLLFYWFERDCNVRQGSITFVLMILLLALKL